jgi:Fanconi anemia group M protein
LEEVALKKMDGKSKEEKVRIIVDIREAHNEVTRRLSEIGVLVVPSRLEVGDYQLSDRLIVERKTTRDFLSSIKDGRLFAQASEMVKYFEKAVLIVEGRLLYSLSSFSPKAIRGSLSSLILDYGISVLITIDASDTAGMLATMAKHEQLGSKGALRHPKKRAKTLMERQEIIVSELPGVGLKLAQELLRHFGSIERLATASEDELMKVEGIGAKRAREIRRVMTSVYGSIK